MSGVSSVTTIEFAYEGSANEKGAGFSITLFDPDEKSPGEITKEELKEIFKELEGQGVKADLSGKGRVGFQVQEASNNGKESNKFEVQLTGTATASWQNSILALWRPEASTESKAPSILKGGPLTKEVLDKIPNDTVAGRILHLVGKATSLQNDDSKSLNSLLLHDDMNILGIVREDLINDWENGTLTGDAKTPGSLIEVQLSDGRKIKAIVLPNKDEKFYEGLREMLGRNTLTKKKEIKINDKKVKVNGFVADFEEMRDLFRIGSDPQKNEENRETGNSGGDGNYTTLNMHEIDAIAKYLGKGWTRKDVMKFLIAPYISLISVYEEALEKG